MPIRLPLLLASALMIGGADLPAREAAGPLTPNQTVNLPEREDVLFDAMVAQRCLAVNQVAQANPNTDPIERLRITAAIPSSLAFLELDAHRLGMDGKKLINDTHAAAARLLMRIQHLDNDALAIEIIECIEWAEIVATPR